MVENRFLVGGNLAEGSYGHIFKAVDTTAKQINGSKVIIKLTKHHLINLKEYTAMVDVGEVAQYCGITKEVPKVFSMGKIVILDPLM